MSLASKLFGLGGGSTTPTPSRIPNNMGDMMSKFAEFKKQYAGKDPNKIINELVSSGKFTQEQVEQARSFVESLGIR